MRLNQAIDRSNLAEERIKLAIRDRRSECDLILRNKTKYSVAIYQVRQHAIPLTACESERSATTARSDGKLASVWRDRIICVNLDTVTPIVQQHIDPSEVGSKKGLRYR